VFTCLHTRQDLSCMYLAHHQLELLLSLLLLLLLCLQDAVAKDEVESLNITVGTQRRAVLEAIAFGTFLRDVESYVDGEYQLLTPAPSPSKGGPGRGPPRPPLTGV